MDKQVTAQKLAKLFFATETINKESAEAKQILAEVGDEAKALIGAAMAEQLHTDLRTSLRLFIKKYNAEAYNQYVARCGYQNA